MQIVSMHGVVSEAQRMLSGGERQRAGSLQAWLTAFAECVRERQFDEGRVMFAPDVTSFGTWTGRMDGLDTLVARQWRNVWPNTCGFAFDLDTFVGHESGDTGWAAATWSSHALNADGSAGFRRTGRATFAFAKREGRWVAVHSHFSLDPAGRL